jgi:hypothetical protein
MTVTIQIGNSDDKLTQSQWCDFVRIIESLIDTNGTRVYFFGGPPTYARWQNAAWVFEIAPENTERLKRLLIELRGKWGQDSIAWTEGETEFI